LSTEGHIATLSGDTNELVNLHKNASYACFTPAGNAKLDALYGKNSILRLAGTSFDIDALMKDPPSGTNLTNFSVPIFSL
jgi:hypothetical protein